MSQPLTWLTLNLEFGGITVTAAGPLLRRHGSVDLSRLRLLPDLVMQPGHAPDVIFLQEGRWFDHNGDELLHYSERLLRQAGVGNYRGLLTRSEHNDLHQVVYVNTTRIEVAHHWRGQDCDEGARRYGFAEIIIDGDEARTVFVKSIHLDPRDGDRRLAQAKFLHGAVKDGQRAIIAGDFNSPTSRRSAQDGEPQRHFMDTPATSRYNKGIWPPIGPDGDTTADTRGVDYLIDTGWTCQHIADHNTTPTVRSMVDPGGELIIDRCLTFGALSTVSGSVHVDTSNAPYSDHRAVWGAVTLDGGHM